jgi:hypothetical protein
MGSTSSEVSLVPLSLNFKDQLTQAMEYVLEIENKNDMDVIDYDYLICVFRGVGRRNASRDFGDEYCINWNYPSKIQRPGSREYSEDFISSIITKS